MKTKVLPLLAFLAIGAATAVAQGILARHTGYTDPLTEGFSQSLSPGGVVGPVTNDFGRNSWSVLSLGSPADYFTSLTPAQQQAIAGIGWSFSATLRITAFPSNSGNFTGLGAFFRTDSGQFDMGFGNTTNGDPFVRVHSSLTPVFILSGGGSAYHIYELQFSAASGLAALWVDGIERVSDITPFSGSGGIISWGAYQGGGTVQANWNEVVLQTIPEPSAVGILGLGLLVVVGLQLRCRHGSANS